MRNSKLTVMRELSNRLDGNLNITVPSAIENVVSSLLVSNGALRIEPEDDKPFTLEFSSTDGMINIDRYESAYTEDVLPANFNAILLSTIQMSPEDVIDGMKEDIANIEQTLMDTISDAHDRGMDITFAFIDGLTYGYCPSPDKNPALLITLQLVEAEDGDVECIFKYSTDMHINVEYKNDSRRRSRFSMKN